MPQSLTASDLVSRLESLFERDGLLFGRLSFVTEAEAEFTQQMQQFKGYSALSKGARSLFLETVERYNTEITPACPTSAVVRQN